MQNLNYNAPLGSTGYGVAGLNFYLELKKLGVNVSLFPIGQDFQGSQEQANAVKEGLEQAKEFDSWAPSLRIWHQFALAERIGRGKSFAMPIFELDTFTAQEKTHLASVDELIVNSQWAADVIKDQTGLDAHVVPLGYDPDVFHVGYGDPNPTTVFMNIGKWEVRKGHDLLCEAFNDAFTPDDDVALWMANHNPFYSDEQNREWQNYYLQTPMGRAGKIVIIPWQGDQSGVASLMQLADVGVFPSRGEGWNLEALEMMACGKHVIVSDYSAHTEFCKNKVNCTAIPVDGIEPAHDGIWFKGQGNWAYLASVFQDALVHALTEAHNSKQTEGECFPALKEGRANTAKEYTWNNSAMKLRKVLYGD